MKNHKAFKAKIKMYKFTYNVVFSTTISRGFKGTGLWNDIVSLYGSKERAVKMLNNADGMFCYFDAKDIYMIVLNVDVKPSIVAHECFHLVCEMMRQIGVNLEEANEEVYAYCLDHVIEKVLEMQEISKKEIDYKK